VQAREKPVFSSGGFRRKSGSSDSASEPMTAHRAQLVIAVAADRTA
jgi:hypothetical protein